MYPTTLPVLSALGVVWVNAIIVGSYGLDDSPILYVWHP